MGISEKKNLPAEKKLMGDDCLWYHKTVWTESEVKRPKWETQWDQCAVTDL